MKIISRLRFHALARNPVADNMVGALTTKTALPSWGKAPSAAYSALSPFRSGARLAMACDKKLPARIKVTNDRIATGTSFQIFAQLFANRNVARNKSRNAY